MTQIVKPFSLDTGYTQIHNYVLDHIMPELSGSEWKILTFILRRTRGWQKDHDRISISQIMAGTGIGSKSTVSQGVEKLISLGYVTKIVATNHIDSNLFLLNTEYCVEVDDNGAIDCDSVDHYPQNKAHHKPGYIYLCHPKEDPELWKVGLTTDPKERMKQLGSEPHHIVYVDDMANAENQLRNQLEANHVRNELYHFTDSEVEGVVQKMDYLKGSPKNGQGVVQKTDTQNKESKQKEDNHEAGGLDSLGTGQSYTPIDENGDELRDLSKEALLQRVWDSTLTRKMAGPRVKLQGDQKKQWEDIWRMCQKDDRYLDFVGHQIVWCHNDGQPHVGIKKWLECTLSPDIFQRFLEEPNLNPFDPLSIQPKEKPLSRQPGQKSQNSGFVYLKDEKPWTEDEIPFD